jgi:catechol 2,3-dioxygenase-like lactoylglutathione lyase family enzyme
MEALAAVKLQEFEEGKISRRRLIETLVAAATTTTAAGAGAAQAAQQVGVKVSNVNHVSYTCPNYRQAADWYSKVFNLEQVGDDGSNVNLPFGKQGEKPQGITANDIGPTFIVARTRDLNGTIGTTGIQRPKATCVIDHMAYTVADFDRERVKADLIAMGIQKVRDGGLYSLHMEDPFGYDIQISGVANNAISDGA